MKQKLGNYAIIALVILNIIIWFVFPPVNDGRENFARAYAGEILGSTVIILMTLQQAGRTVVIVGSVAGSQPLPLHGVYSATKSFDNLLGEALWAELRGSGVDVLSVLPALWVFFTVGAGPTSSAIYLIAGFIGLLALDWSFWRQGLAPEWWMRLRILLTVVVGACLSLLVI